MRRVYSEPSHQRVFDVVVAVSGLVVLAPILPVLAGLIVLDDGPSTIYASPRARA